ncbi:transposable element P transposase [Trichonephila clavipes]|nr:transposable element P transposase [Trichonephila clavipes]
MILKVRKNKAVKVCELHFLDDAIRRYTEAYNEKTGEKICVPLKRFRLQNFAVPTTFTDFPTYLSNSGNPSRKCPEQRLQILENPSKHYFRGRNRKKKSFTSVPELVECLNAEMSFRTYGLLFVKMIKKIQTDALESRFGKYRTLSGSQYLISIRQLYEIEAKLRMQNFLPLTMVSNTYGQLNLKDIHLKDSGNENPLESSVLHNFNITLSEKDFRDAQPYLPVLTYLARVCVRAALKN